MDGSHHMAAIRELDLSACHPSSIADRINAVPGLKTSTAFFTFLRANLVLPPSPMSSNVSTPLLEPTAALAPPSPSPLAAQGGAAAKTTTTTNAAADPALDDIPPLSLDVLTRREDKVDALRLVADSIAQQRQQAALALVFHPLCLAALLAALAGVYQWAWVRRGRDVGLALMVGSGVVMAYLTAIRGATAGYLRAAEAIRWEWLVAPDEGGGAAGVAGEEDVVIATRFGGEVVGALVLRLEPSEQQQAAWAAASQGGAGASRRRTRAAAHAGLRGGRGVVRAWTTRLRYRGRGVGADMLHEAVRVTRERCGRDAEVGFAREHANSAAVLPELLNGWLRAGERRAARALEGVLAEWEGARRKR